MNEVRISVRDFLKRPDWEVWKALNNMRVNGADLTIGDVERLANSVFRQDASMPENATALVIEKSHNAEEGEQYLLLRYKDNALEFV